MKAKKIVALLLTAAMTLSLMACGGSSSTSTETAETAATETKEETAATETEAAATEEEAEDLLADIIPEETVTLDVFDQ